MYMLILDYHNWDQSKMPIICEMFKDKRCPCLKNCIILPNCTKACNPMGDYIITNVSETLSYLREHLGNKYYNHVEKGQTMKAVYIFEGLVNLHYHTVAQDEGIYDEWACLTKRFVYAMKRSYQIAKNKCLTKSNSNMDHFTIAHFFIGM